MPHVRVGSWIGIGFTTIVLVGVGPTLGQDPPDLPDFVYHDVGIHAPPEQLAKLDAAAQRHYEKSALKQDEHHRLTKQSVENAEDLRAELAQLDVEFESEIEALLTPDQLRKVRDGGQKRLRDRVERDASYLGAVAGYLQAVARAETLTLYEGLPHPREEKLMAEEIKKSSTVVLSGFHFYAQRRSPREADVRPFRQLSSDYRSFEPYGGPKFCGGYHPDWCLEWQLGDDGEVYQLFICLGCHEAHFVGPRGELRVDIQSPAYERFRDLLKPYDKNRP